MPSEAANSSAQEEPLFWERKTLADSPLVPQHLCHKSLELPPEVRFWEVAQDRLISKSVALIEPADVASCCFVRKSAADHVESRGNRLEAVEVS